MMKKRVSSKKQESNGRLRYEEEVEDVVHIGCFKKPKVCNFKCNQYKESILPLRRELEEPTFGWPLLWTRTKSISQNHDSKSFVLHQPLDVVPKISKPSSLSKPIASSMPSNPGGWPLLRVKVSETFEEISVAQWAMKLPTRSSLLERNENQKIVSLDDNDDDSFQNSDGSYLTSPRDLREKSEVSIEQVSYRCKQFSYEELKEATTNFYSGNLIGEGGYSNVYKGYLSSGKPVAVKILKPYKEAPTDFFLEVDIISSLNHKHITPLLGVCVENGHLISVYDFYPVGNLDQKLNHNTSTSLRHRLRQKKSSVLTWDLRFRISVAIADALNYLHNQCSPPIIHRDVKSSNILLFQDFQPQLSDFGLAIRGPVSSSMVHSDDVVGSFGYIAPEYFMHGRISDKIDMYSFGVVLLELISGRKCIDHRAVKGEESLVKWAKPLLESGDFKELIDPSFDGKFDILQMHRMLLAATLCTNSSARYRPTASQISKLLKGDHDGEKQLMNAQDNESDDDNDASQYSFGTMSVFSIGHKHLTLRDYLREQED